MTGAKARIGCDYPGCDQTAQWMTEGGFWCHHPHVERKSDEPDSPAELGRLMERRDAASDAGMEGADGGAAPSSGLDVAPERAGEVGRARVGLTDPLTTARAIADTAAAAAGSADTAARTRRTGGD